VRDAVSGAMQRCAQIDESLAEDLGGIGRLGASMEGGGLSGEAGPKVQIGDDRVIPDSQNWAAMSCQSPETVEGCFMRIRSLGLR
jgi:hypothetical protein